VPGEVAFDAITEEAHDRVARAATPASGSWAVNQSANLGMMKGAEQMQRNEYFDAEGNVVRIENVAQLPNNAFFNQNGQWVDTRYDGSVEPIQVQRFSRAYFQILQMDPELGQAMALGDSVMLWINGNAVEIADTGRQEFKNVELLNLFGRGM
jgi:hypothetical protein